MNTTKMQARELVKSALKRNITLKSNTAGYDYITCGPIIASVGPMQYGCYLYDNQCKSGRLIGLDMSPRYSGLYIRGVCR